jgi:hypothetical protein
MDKETQNGFDAQISATHIPKRCRNFRRELLIGEGFTKEEARIQLKKKIDEMISNSRSYEFSGRVIFVPTKLDKRNNGYLVKSRFLYSIEGKDGVTGESWDEFHENLKEQKTA